LIIERVSGQRFADFLRGKIFIPQGMNHRAYGYSRNAAWHRTDQSVTSATLGDGGIYTSIDDLVHWIAWLDSGRFAQALVPATKTDRPGMQYGFGWFIGEHRGRRMVSHFGETIGFRNAIVRFPDQRLAVVVLTNRNEGVPEGTALRIADMFLPP